MTADSPDTLFKAGKHALLFINGEPPKELPDTVGYAVIACSDGAFHYLKAKNFPLEKLDFVSGDQDSCAEADLGAARVFNFHIYHTPDQDKTDFHKALEILQEKNITHVDVYGGSGGEMDHFLGNLSVAYFFKDKLSINFFDQYSRYFFAPKNCVLREVLHRTVSLYPFPGVEGLTTSGLQWPLHNADLNLTTRIGTRNFAVEPTVEIRFENGALIVFVSH